MKPSAPDATPSSKNNLRAVQEKIGYTFSDPQLLQRALTHCSGTNKAEEDCGRLAFLGSDIVRMAVVSLLIVDHPDANRAVLNDRTRAATSPANLANACYRLDLLRYARLGRGLLNEPKISTRVFSQLYQALCGALYIDLGFDGTRDFVKQSLTFEPLSVAPSKTELQHLVQHRFHCLPKYQMIRKTGPDHDTLFEVVVIVNGQGFGIGKGRSKKDAESAAAETALGRLSQERSNAPVASTPLPSLPKPAKLPVKVTDKRSVVATPSKQPLKAVVKPSSTAKFDTIRPQRIFGYCAICLKFFHDVDAHREECHKIVAQAPQKQIRKNWPSFIGRLTSPCSLVFISPDYVKNPYATRDW